MSQGFATHQIRKFKKKLFCIDNSSLLQDVSPGNSFKHFSKPYNTTFNLVIGGHNNSTRVRDG
jgi:hypothetical protein